MIQDYDWKAFLCSSLRGVFVKRKSFVSIKNKLIEALTFRTKYRLQNWEHLWYNKRKSFALKYNLYKLTRTQTCTRSFLSIVVEPFVFPSCFFSICKGKNVCVRLLYCCYAAMTIIFFLYYISCAKRKCQYYQKCTGKYS